MPWPLAIAAGSAALSAYMNWRASQAGQAAAQNASEAELAAIKEVMDKIEREWDLPEYDRSPVTLEEYKQKMIILSSNEASQDEFIYLHPTVLGWSMHVFVANNISTNLSQRINV
jgi:hypothetical protein